MIIEVQNKCDRYDVILLTKCNLIVLKENKRKLTVDNFGQYDVDNMLNYLLSILGSYVTQRNVMKVLRMKIENIIELDECLWCDVERIDYN